MSSLIGVRIAHGADRTAVRNMILREGLLKGTVGIAFGMCGAFFVARVLAGLLFGVSVDDTAVFIATPVVLEFVIAIAVFVPAQMAACLNPVRALRVE
jgi:ABC-type antimicrobial peptide transport system permease subunit